MAGKNTQGTQRHTRQRAAIRKVFLENDRPLTAQEILTLGQKSIAGMGLATVYRTVKALAAEGWLSLVEMPGEPPRYEIAGKGHHHHFQCRSCGGLFEIHACNADFQRLMPEGFRLEGHEIFLYGECRDCLLTGRPSVSHHEGKQTAAVRSKDGIKR